MEKRKILLGLFVVLLTLDLSMEAEPEARVAARLGTEVLQITRQIVESSDTFQIFTWILLLFAAMVSSSADFVKATGLISALSLRFIASDSMSDSTIAISAV